MAREKRLEERFEELGDAIKEVDKYREHGGLLIEEINHAIGFSETRYIRTPLEKDHQILFLKAIDNRDNIERYINRYNLKKSSPQFKIRCSMASRMNSLLKQYKDESTIELLGASLTKVKNHLEKQFSDNMSWDNHSLKGWHIDHIKPCASFDLTNPEQQKECFHYTNLQPLWAEDNLSKSDKLDWVKEA